MKILDWNAFCFLLSCISRIIHTCSLTTLTVINLIQLYCLFLDNCKYVESGIFYRGTANKTKTGKGCLPWKMFLPNLKLLGYPTKALEENYCRNFNKKGAGPWCYVNEDSAFEYCDIPKCPGKD